MQSQQPPLSLDAIPPARFRRMYFTSPPLSSRTAGFLAGGGGPGGIFILDHLDFNVMGRWEVDRGPQELAYDFWWHLGHLTARIR